MTRWLVDAMNVIGSRPDGWWKDRRGAMRRLAGQLGDLAATGDEVGVVYDGREFGDPPAAEGVEVVFAPGGRNAADHRIAARVEADADPESITVVTSDRELAKRVRAAGAGVEGSAGFRRRLDGLADTDDD